jgi:hypothetical protein
MVMAEKEVKTQETEVIKLPEPAQNAIKEFRAQMISIQAQLQQFIDGMLIGMGVDIEQHPNVDLDAMTITVMKKKQE